MFNIASVAILVPFSIDTFSANAVFDMCLQIDKYLRLMKIIFVERIKVRCNAYFASNKTVNNERGTAVKQTNDNFIE